MREELTCHCNICKGCFKGWIESKVRDGQVLPHIRCPEFDCDCSIPYGNFISYGLSVDVSLPRSLSFYLFLSRPVHTRKKQTLYHFASVYIEKMLARNSNWQFCGNGKCKYGVLLTIKETEKDVECEACDTKYVQLPPSSFVPKPLIALGAYSMRN